MKFVLTYQGPLPPKQKGVSKLKAQLRAHFEPQLREEVSRYRPEGLSEEHRSQVNNTTYEALVTRALRNEAELDILLLTPRRLARPGDVDNRIKTLFDGLTTPTPGQAEIGGTATFSLLEDDHLIRSYRVDSRPWLGRSEGGPASNDSLAIIDVTIVSAGPPTWGGLFLSI